MKDWWYYISMTIVVAVTVALMRFVIILSIPHKNSNGDRSVYSGSNLYRISDTSLTYDNDTKVIYYWKRNGYMVPYYNEHGQLCRYVDGKIVPIK